MKKFKGKIPVILGVIVVVLLALSSWYSIVFNDWRLVKPMDFSAYQFLARDLPMLASLFLFILYVLYLFALLIGIIAASRQRAKTAKTTRKLNPKLGLLGFAGFFGFLGFWSYSQFHEVYPFIFFVFFGFFGFFYEGRMSNILMDERFEENRMRAELTAHRVAQAVVFLTLLLVGRGALMGSLEYTLIAAIILISLAYALDLFLSEYLLYRYDSTDQLDDGGED